MKYSLIDSGEGQKLEKYGDFLFIRPDPQVVWEKELSKEIWQTADIVFDITKKDKRWKIKKKLPDNDWIIEAENLKFKINLSNFKHIGVFPEHIENWKWLSKRAELFNSKTDNSNKMKVLNLFGYTGGATLALIKAGASVVHLDASKPAIVQAKENLKINNLNESSVRWILDDAKKFVKREINRGVFYDGVLLDPPSFGRGAKGEVWKIEKDLLVLLQDVKKLLRPDFDFILLNGYASLYTPIAYAQLLESVFGLENIEYGELTIKEDTKRAFLLPAGIFARWAKK